MRARGSRPRRSADAEFKKLCRKRVYAAQVYLAFCESRVSIVENYSDLYNSYVRKKVNRVSFYRYTLPADDECRGRAFVFGKISESSSLTRNRHIFSLEIRSHSSIFLKW